MIQGPLGFASGIPLYLSGTTLAAHLSSEGVSLETVGLFALVSLPYSLKFAWAPLLDRFRLPWLDRRRGWIAVFQIALVGLVGAMAFVDAAASPALIAVVALAVAIVSASQDIVVDAYRTDVLGEHERGRGTAFYVTGYRIALLCAGSGALIVADAWSWRAAYLLMAAMLALGVVATVLSPAPAYDHKPPATLHSAVIEPFRELLGRPGALLILAFVMLYKLGDLLALQMIIPFLLDLDFSKTEVGVIQNGLGMAATIVGCAIGGVLADRIGVRKSLIAFGILQAGANVGYLALAISGPDRTALMAAIGIDNVCNGLGTAAFVAFLMSLCDRRFSATQYALLTSASGLLGRLLSASSGSLAVGVGWTWFFGLTMFAALPALALMLWATEEPDIPPRIA